jgi:hypothetical protein
VFASKHTRGWKEKETQGKKAAQVLKVNASAAGYLRKASSVTAYTRQKMKEKYKWHWRKLSNGMHPCVQISVKLFM